MEAHRTPARGLTHFDTARNHHPFDGAPMSRDMAGTGDMARRRPGRDEIGGKSRRLDGAESKHARQGEREGIRLHRSMFLRSRSVFNTSIIAWTIFASGARVPSRSGGRGGVICKN